MNLKNEQQIGLGQSTVPRPLWNRIKGALDKYNIYLLMSNSIENFKLKQY